MFFFFKQKTAYEIGTGDWSSDVCLPSRSLLKQVHNNSDSEEVVKSWTCQAEGEDWTGLQDRGKLYHVNDQFRDLLVAMDEVSTSVTRDITGN